MVTHKRESGEGEEQDGDQRVVKKAHYTQKLNSLNLLLHSSHLFYHIKIKTIINKKIHYIQKTCQQTVKTEVSRQSMDYNLFIIFFLMSSFSSVIYFVRKRNDVNLFSILVE